MPRLNLASALALGVAALLAPRLARAHFILQAPPNWMSQVPGDGSPQKMGPCGNEGGGTASGIVTPYRPGDTVTVTIAEVVTHPGHYRIALSVNDRSELPAEPALTPTSTCVDAAIQNPPVFPVLADNVFPHTSAFGGPQTTTVTLPTNITCAKCTLQVIEFMSAHGTPCFYHHCADISIQGPPVDGGGTGGAAGADAGGGGGSGGTGSPKDGGAGTSGSGGGCGCRFGDTRASWLAIGVMLVSLLARRRTRAL